MFERKDSEELSLTPEALALERQLAALEIGGLHLDRDRLMFAAGRAAERSERETMAPKSTPASWFWPTATALATAACLVLSAMLVERGREAQVAQDAAASRGAESPTIAAPTIAAPTRQDQPELARWAGDAMARDWARPRKGGYLKDRYLALQGGDETDAMTARQDVFHNEGPRQSATPRDLLKEFLPAPAPGPESSS